MHEAAFNTIVLRDIIDHFEFYTERKAGNFRRFRNYVIYSDRYEFPGINPQGCGLLGVEADNAACVNVGP
jgi:hypothetical protein